MEEGFNCRRFITEQELRRGLGLDVKIGLSACGANPWRESTTSAISDTVIGRTRESHSANET